MKVLNAPTYEWTVDEWEKLGEAGIFHEDDRVELLNGEIVIMSPIGIRHAKSVNWLTNFFGRRSQDRFEVSPQNPFNLDKRSQPQPDLCLLDLKAAALPHHPTADLIYLVIEVADSSVRYDRGDKRTAYARNRVGEFWLVNLDENVLEVYADADGKSFRESKILQPKEQIAPRAFPDLKFRVRDCLALLEPLDGAR
ncbi:MAG TPA: Uma2 family endonuclease [Chthoniobacteraceae bacterium]|jgi:Uma2 family endonuclease|nr:Uma2 family endonuclease [Chthoniobacteraceae bacterium]